MFRDAIEAQIVRITRRALSVKVFKSNHKVPEMIFIKNLKTHQILSAILAFFCDNVSQSDILVRVSLQIDNTTTQHNR